MQRKMGKGKGDNKSKPDQKVSDWNTNRKGKNNKDAGEGCEKPPDQRVCCTCSRTGRSDRTDGWSAHRAARPDDEARV